ncbi:hypothetical protein MTO96_023961 [Rhipicephalus appendiculatus]
MTTPHRRQGVSDELMAMPAASPRAELVEAILGPAPGQPGAEADEVSQAASLAGMAVAKEARSSASVHGGNFNVSIFAALTTGATVGIVLRFLATKPWSSRHVMYLGFPGEILRRLLREAALPLSASSVIAASASLQRTLSMRVACFALIYTLVVKLASQANAVLTTLAIQPGRVLEAGDLQRMLDAVPPHARLYEPALNGTAADLLFDIARTVFPDNIVDTFVHTDGDESVPFPNKTGLHAATSSRLVGHQASLLLFCAMLGYVLSAHGGSGTLLGFFIGFSNAMMYVVHFILMYAPFGLFFATAAYVVQPRNLQPVVSYFGLYLFTLVLSLAMHSLLVLPLVAASTTKRTFRGLLQNAATPLAVAFNAASSSETVPATMAALEERLNLDTKIVRLLVPMAAVFNTDGTSIYITISALFFAQTKSDNVDLRTIVIICSRLATAVDVLTGLIGVHVVQHYCGLEESPTTEDANRELAH